MSIDGYIKENLRKGVKLAGIKEALLSSGYDIIQINNAIKKLYNEQVVNLAKYINKKIKLGLEPSAVKNYLISLGHPEGQVDEAIGKIVRAKKYILRKKKIEKTKEQFSQIKTNIRRNSLRYLSVIKLKIRWIFEDLAGLLARLKPWQRYSYVPAAVVFVIILFWEIIMMLNSIILSGRLNCYSFGRIVSCSFFESVFFYVIMMVAMVIIFCLPVFGIGLLAYHLFRRSRR